MGWEFNQGHSKYYRTLLLFNVTGWYRTKRPMHCDNFLIYCESPYEFWSLLIHPPEFSSKYQQTPSSESVRNLARNVRNFFPAKYLCHTPQGSWTCRKILRHGADSFTSPQKKVVLRIFIALKIHRPRPGLNPRMLYPVTSTIISRAARTTRIL
jgi:hypothetical protein